MTSTSTDRRQGVNAGAAIKVPCRVATTANITLSGEQTIDGVAVVDGDRVLVKDQTTGSENGIYVADTSAWERALDWDGAFDVQTGTLVKVNAGSTNQGFWYVSTTGTITIDTTSVAIARASTVLAVVTAFAQTLLDDASAAEARTTLDVPSNAEAILDTLIDAKGDIIVGTAADTPTRKAVGTDGYRLSPNSGDTDGLRYLPPGIGLSLINGYLDWTVSGNALTCTVKGLDGNAPSTTNPVFAWIRSATATTGSPTLAKLTSATTASLSSGSTVGTRSNIACRIWAVLFDDAGTYRLGLINCVTSAAGAGAGSNVTAIYPLTGWGIASSTAEGGAGAADSAQTFYTTTAVSSKPYTTLGYATFESGQATAGTWASTPSRMQLYMSGTPLPGWVIQTQANDTGTMATGTTQIPSDDTIPQITEGDQYMTQAITPSSAANVLDIEINCGSNAASAIGTVTTVALFQDATANAIAAVMDTHAANYTRAQRLRKRLLAATTSATTFRMRAGVDASGGTLTFNGQAAGAKLGGVLASSFIVTEIMG